MVFELIAVIAAGFLGGGVALVLRRGLPALPRWLVPVAAGAAMLVVAVSLEYSWFDRTAGDLPDGLDVVLTHEARAPWRPWTYAAPYVDRFVAVDRASLMTHEAAPDRRLATLVVFARWRSPTRVRAVFDCAAGRRADLAPGARLTDDGDVEGATWHTLDPDGPVMRSVCR